jgi:hypothetical protein
MANIEEDGQSCIQEVNDNWGSDVVAVEKCLYTHKWVDGSTVTIPQLLDNDLTHWFLVNDDSYRDLDSSTKITRGKFL